MHDIYLDTTKLLTFREKLIYGWICKNLLIKCNIVFDLIFELITFYAFGN
jgi:hypothetical protein